MQEKSKKKMLNALQKKPTWGHFTLNRRSVYLGLIYGKQAITVKPVQSRHVMQRTPGFAGTFLRHFSVRYGQVDLPILN